MTLMIPDREAIKLEKLKYRFNLIIIALLCSKTLAPIVIFFIRGTGEIWVLLIFIAINFLVSRLPRSFYDRSQLSWDNRIYKKLKVHLVKRYATKGDLINRRIRNRYPTHRNIFGFESIKGKLNETYSIERSHTVLFSICLMTCIYAFLINSVETAILLLIGNLLFNYYPILLQQYNRIRYMNVIKKYPERNIC